MKTATHAESRYAAKRIIIIASLVRYALRFFVIYVFGVFSNRTKMHVTLFSKYNSPTIRYTVSFSFRHLQSGVRPLFAVVVVIARATTRKGPNERRTRNTTVFAPFHANVRNGLASGGLTRTSIPVTRRGGEGFQIFFVRTTESSLRAKGRAGVRRGQSGAHSSRASRVKFTLNDIS